MLALGKLRITSAGRTCTILSAERSTLTASASADGRSAVTSTSRFWEATASLAITLATWAAETVTLVVKVLNPT